ncbi:MAG: penicillin-binding protein 2 [bacterium]|nr:penicillin-binding protein 2 [bacterium]
MKTLDLTVNRYRILSFLTCVFFGVLFIRLFFLQVIRYDFFYKKSLANSIRITEIPGLRGEIFDRYGNVIAENTVSYSLYITPNEFGNSEKKLKKFCELLNLDTLLLKKVLFGKNASKNKAVRVLRDMSFQEISTIEEFRADFAGIFIQQETKRHYKIDCGAHFFGYISEPNEVEIEKNPSLRGGTMIGRVGLEKTYDTLLRGIPGLKFRLIDVEGKELGPILETPDIAPGSGRPLKISIDPSLQSLAESLLIGKNGAIVAIEPKTGEILCFASSPTYSPKLFDGAISGKVWKALSEDPNKPLFNRALQAMYPPGSTFKMTVLAAALEYGLIDTSQKIFCGGGIQIGNRFFKDASKKGHGAVNAKLSIAASCDVYYYVLGQRIGLKRLNSIMLKLGYGKKTNVDLDLESSGLAPSEEWYEKRNYQWGAGTLANLGIGQGEILVTPIQQAVNACIWANGGWYIQPHLVVAYGDTLKGEWIRPQYPKIEVNLKDWIFPFIRRAMRETVSAPYGTAARFEKLGYDAAGKTGTAQNPHGNDHAWFICFAPFEDPKIALSVLVENSGWGGVHAAPIAFEIIGRYLGKPANLFDFGVINDHVSGD